MMKSLDRLLSSPHWCGCQRCASPHAYDAPGLDSLGFLRAVRDDKTVPLALRAKAGASLLPYEQNDPSQYPDIPDPLSAPPDMTKYYEGFLKVVREYHKKFGGKRKSIDFYYDILSMIQGFHHECPNVPHQPIDFYVELLQHRRCGKTGKVLSLNLEDVEPEGHA